MRAATRCLRPSTILTFAGNKTGVMTFFSDLWSIFAFGVGRIAFFFFGHSTHVWNTNLGSRNLWCLCAFCCLFSLIILHRYPPPLQYADQAYHHVCRFYRAGRNLTPLRVFAHKPLSLFLSLFFSFTILLFYSSAQQEKEINIVFSFYEFLKG